MTKDTSARILFESDRTCCVCRMRGKPVQIHHIDGDHSNDESLNLAVLCFDCHRDTQIKGGFDRKLDSIQVILYRDDWVARVLNRRTLDHGPSVLPRIIERVQLDSLAVLSEGKEPEAYTDIRSSAGLELDLKMLHGLPTLLRNAYHSAEPLWDSGVTATMREGNGKVIQALLGMLEMLAQYYSPKHFEDTTPRKYFENRVTQLYDWHWKCLEPDGPGTGGTIMQVISGGQITSELRSMVEDMVMALTTGRDDFNYQSWRKDWTGDSK